MSRLRQALTFENVLVTVVAFAVLAGGTAIAANQLAKNSVGKKQLKAKSVTAAKIKKNAVTTAKLKNGAVTGAKVKDGSLLPADMNLDSVPYGRIVHTASASAPAQLPAGPEPTVLPLANPAYTQPPGRDDTFSGRIEVNFSEACTPPRVALAFVTLDGDPAALDERKIAASGIFYSEDGGGGSASVNLGPAIGAGVSFQPAAPVAHTLGLAVLGGCSGGTATVTAAQVSVQGVGG